METEYRGDKYYSPRNYTNASYTYNIIRSQNIQALISSDLIGNIGYAKSMCLNMAERELDEPMMSIERDEEYLPVFKDCVKNAVVEYLNDRAASGKGLAMAKYTLTEDTADSAIDKGLDAIKLKELAEHDIQIYNQFHEEL